jgi:two-component system cell cycle response regulator
VDDLTQDKTIVEDPHAPLVPTAAAASPCLTVISGGTVGTVHALPLGKTTVIGRGADTDMQIVDARISRRHAKISVDSKGASVLEDLRSSNGTFLNSIRIQQQKLKEGDHLQLGSGTVLKFFYQDKVEQEVQQELADRAMKDRLTDIYTEQYLLDRIGSEYAYALRHKTDLALLMFEVDDFKNIKGNHGASACELVFKELASLVKKALRAEDVFARYSKIALAILTRGIPDAGALVVAQRLRRAIKAHSFVFQQTRIPVTISIGMATGSDQAKSAAKLIEIAEKYLRRAQKAKNSIGGLAVKTLVERGDKNSAVTIRYT